VSRNSQLTWTRKGRGTVACWQTRRSDGRRPCCSRRGFRAIRSELNCPKSNTVRVRAPSPIRRMNLGAIHSCGSFLATHCLYI
jgi:hypothetical protein